MPELIIQNKEIPRNDPYEGLDAVDALEIRGDEHYKIAILGAPKNGKSWFATTLPGYNLVYDFDDRWISLQGKPNTRIEKSLRDTMDSPWVVNKLEKDLSLLKYRKSQGKIIPDNYIFDSVTNLLIAIKHQYLQDNPKDGRRIKVGGKLLQIGISYDLVNTQVAFINYLVTEYSLLGNVVFIFHEKDEKDRDRSTKEETKYTGLITVDPQFIANVLTTFNEVFRIKVTGDSRGEKYTVYCKPNTEVTASTTLLLDSEEAPNLTQMIQKHKERKEKKEKEK